MQNTVYFPNFEPPSESWLKFALLYMENFRPIIPYSVQHLTSQQYKDIINNTHLINPYHPGTLQGERASLKAIEFVENIMNHPYAYSTLFRQSHILRDIRNPQQWNYKLHSDKFSMHWVDFCIRNGFAQNDRSWLVLSEDLGFIYMSFLAEEIAFEEGFSVITDNIKYDHFLNYKRTVPAQARNRHLFAQGIMSLVIPQNISNIPIARLIKFRDRNEELIKAFNRELDCTINNIRDGITERDFVNRYNDIYGNLNREIISLGSSVLTIPLSLYLLIQSPISLMPEYIQEVLGGLGILLAGKNTINTSWKELSMQRDCKRYFTNLRRL